MPAVAAGRARAARLLVAGALAAGGVVATAAPASAYCDPVLEAVTGRCENGCTLVARAYDRAERATKDALPDVEIYCYA